MIVLVDDGSMDDGASRATEVANENGISVEVVAMPPKRKGNLDTLGHAWNKAQPILHQLAKEVNYFAFADVDSKFPPDYFEKMIEFLEKSPHIGVVAGQMRGEPKRTFPMFSGKVVRSEVIDSIYKYWDISIDSFINIKALAMGYYVTSKDDILVESKPSHLLTKSGRFRSGRLAYYAGVNIPYILAKGIIQRDAQYLRGYWSEWSKGTWRSDDPDIRNYYDNQFRRKLTRLLVRVFRTIIH